jgi:hypothetical protein
MDWMGDDVGLSDNDLERVFKYEAKQTIVIKLVESKGVIISLLTRYWHTWINTCRSTVVKFGRSKPIMTGRNGS